MFVSADTTPPTTLRKVGNTPKQFGVNAVRVVFSHEECARAAFAELDVGRILFSGEEEEKGRQWERCNGHEFVVVRRRVFS